MTQEKCRNAGRPLIESVSQSSSVSVSSGYDSKPKPKYGPMGPTLLKLYKKRLLGGIYRVLKFMKIGNIFSSFHNSILAGTH